MRAWGKSREIPRGLWGVRPPQIDPTLRQGTGLLYPLSASHWLGLPATQGCLTLSQEAPCRECDCHLPKLGQLELSATTSGRGPGTPPGKGSR